MSTNESEFPDRRLYEKIVKTYKDSGSFRETVEKCHVSEYMAHRVLVTENLNCDDTSFDVKSLYDLGYTPSKISRKLNLPQYLVEINIPYSAPAYGPREDQGDSDLVLKLHLELVGDFYSGADINLNMKEEDRRDFLFFAKAHAGISRDILVPADMNLHALHYAIQKLFGWQNSHLHHFALPQKEFDGLTANFADYMNLCGSIFRFPDEDPDDAYWDEDYEDGMSFSGWLKKKYRRPYRAGSAGDSYLGNEWEIEECMARLPQIKLDDSLQSLSEKIVFEEDFNTLVERLSVGELFLPKSLQETNLQGWKESMDFKADDLAATLDLADLDRESLRDDLEELRACRQDSSNKSQVKYWENRCKKPLEDWNVRLDPFFPEIYYLYDYGDGWCIKISVTEREHNRLASEAMNGNPVCVAADGLNLVDDCGGPYGYLDMLWEINGEDPEKAMETKEWARSMGWSGRLIAPERML